MSILIQFIQNHGDEWKNSSIIYDLSEWFYSSVEVRV